MSASSTLTPTEDTTTTTTIEVPKTITTTTITITTTTTTTEDLLQCTMRHSRDQAVVTMEEVVTVVDITDADEKSYLISSLCT